MERTGAGAISERRLWRGALAGLCATLVGVGLTRFAYTPLIPALIAAGWFSPSEAVFLGATNLAGYLAGAVSARRCSLRLGAGTTIRAAMLLAALSFVTCAWPLGVAWFLPWRFLSGLTGGVLMVVAAPTILAHTPQHRRGRVSGIVFTGVGLGVAASGTLVPLLAGQGLTVVWLTLTAVTLLLTALTWNSWPDDSLPAAVSSAGGHGPARLTLPIGLLMIAYACDAVGFVPHTVFWVDYIARGLGQGLAVGGGYWIVFGVGAVTGPLLAGMSAERIGFSRSLILALALKAAAVGMPLAWTNPVALAGSSAMVGALTPGLVALVSGRVAELAGMQGQKQVWGWMTSGFAVAQAGGAYGMSFLFAQTGSYKLLFILGCSALLLSVVCAVLLDGRFRPVPAEGVSSR